MEIRLDTLVKNNYETLPELLQDLLDLVNISKLDQWHARIDCGGDLHNLYFFGNKSDLLNNKYDSPYEDIMNSTYENMESLMAELEYLQDYLEQHQTELGNVRLSYEVNANGGKPFLRVNCSHYKNLLDYPLENFNDDSILNYSEPNKYQEMFYAGLLTFVQVAPILLLIKYLDS